MAIFFGTKPSMIRRRLGIVLRLEQFIERVLLRGVWQQSDDHAVHAKIRRDGTRVILRDGQRMAIPRQGCALVVIDVSGDPVGSSREWGFGELWFFGLFGKRRLRDW